MPLFNNRKVLGIRKVGLRDSLITISKMKENFFQKMIEESYLIRLYRQNMQSLFWTTTYYLQLELELEVNFKYISSVSHYSDEKTEI